MPYACLGSYRQSPGLNECRLWRESIADIVVIGEDADGHIDLADLESQLARYAYRPLLFGSFAHLTANRRHHDRAQAAARL